MKKSSLLLLGALLSLALPMCQVAEGPPPAGSVRAVDPAADALMTQATALQQQNKQSAAISKLKELVRMHPLAPNAPQARFLLGQLFEQKRDYREAFKQYAKLIDSYQNSELYASALNRQMSLALNAASGKLKTPVLWGAWDTNMESKVVEDWLQAIIDKAPYNDTAATAASILGKYLVEKGEYEKARRVYAQLSERYPDSPYAPSAQLMLAQLWKDSRTRGDRNLVNVRNAQEAYEEFTLRFPNHPDAGKALQQASDMSRQIVQQELDVGKYYLDRSKEYQAAIFCFEDVIRQKNTNPEAAREAETLLQKARHLAGAPRS